MAGRGIPTVFAWHRHVQSEMESGAIDLKGIEYAVGSFVATWTRTSNGGSGYKGGNQHLAEMLHCRPATVGAALAHLEELGLVRKVGSVGRQGRNTEWIASLPSGEARVELPAKAEHQTFILDAKDLRAYKLLSGKRQGTVKALYERTGGRGFGVGDELHDNLVQMGKEVIYYGDNKPRALRVPQDGGATPGPRQEESPSFVVTPADAQTYLDTNDEVGGVVELREMYDQDEHMFLLMVEGVARSDRPAYIDRRPSAPK